MESLYAGNASLRLLLFFINHIGRPWSKGIQLNKYAKQKEDFAAVFYG